MDVASGLDRFFEITKRGSNISTEVKGGILVFLSMAYIISVNTGMMATSGMDESACYTATIVMSIIGSLLMGFMQESIGLPLGFALTAIAYTAGGVVYLSYVDGYYRRLRQK